MKRQIARWLISRSIDDPTCPIPAWVQRAIQRDRTLRDYQRSAQQLVQHLQQDASQWIGDSGDRQFVGPASRAEDPVRALPSTTGSLVLALAVAASLLITMKFWSDTPAPQLPLEPTRSSPVAQTTEQAPIELQPWEDSWNVGRRMVDQFSQHAEHLAGTISAPVAPAWDGDPRDPVASAGVAYGRVLATLDREVQHEQDRIAAKVRGTIHFFAHHLPTQVANASGLPRP